MVLYIQINHVQTIFQSICYTTFDSQIFPNTYECFIRPLNPQHDQINIIVTPPLKDLTYKIQQQDNILMMYLLFADFGTVPQKSQVIQQISKQVYEQILNSVQNDQCKCWGRYRQKENNCRCQDGYYPPAETTFGLLDCTPCNYKCLTCQFTSTQCISCPLNSNRKLDLDIYSCECKEGYLELGVIVCSPCHYSCGKCETFPYKCTECNSAHHRTWDNINFLCPCDDGYYDDGSNSICVKCDHSCSIIKIYIIQIINVLKQVKFVQHVLHQCLELNKQIIHVHVMLDIMMMVQILYVNLVIIMSEQLTFPLLYLYSFFVYYFNEFIGTFLHKSEF